MVKKMENMNIGDVVAVSRYWTPQHIDMTYASVEYARSKPSWIDRLEEHRSFARIDWRDRMNRRAQHSKVVVAPEEIRILPPLAAPAPAAQRQAVSAPQLEPLMLTFARFFGNQSEGSIGLRDYVRR